MRVFLGFSRSPPTGSPLKVERKSSEMKSLLERMFPVRMAIVKPSHGVLVHLSPLFD